MYDLHGQYFNPDCGLCKSRLEAATMANTDTLAQVRTLIEKLRLTAHRSPDPRSLRARALLGWIAANAPGGWIDQLRHPKE